jgi:adenylate cyclase
MFQGKASVLVRGTCGRAFAGTVLKLGRMTRLRDLVRERKPSIRLPGWLERVTSVGIVTQDPRIARRQRITNVAAFATAGNTISHLIINSYHNFDGLLIIHLYNAAMTVAALLTPLLHRFGQNTAAMVLLILIIAGNTFVVWMLGTSSGLEIYFTLAGAILLFFGVENWKSFLAFFIAAAAALLITLNFAPTDGLILPDDHDLRATLFSQAMVNTIVINALMVFYALTALHRAEAELENQYARSEALLSAMMPSSVAERLKSGTETRIADRIGNLSILFADMVGFTAVAHALPPEQVVDYLDDLVRAFDTLCEQHGVEKIKTIGDCYMAIAGRGGDARAGACALGRFALAMMETMDCSQSLHGQRLSLRVGIHCGAVTAGVIGDTRFTFDVWGDAVNTASRMESHGLPRRIQVSEAFRDLTKDVFLFEERGPTEIKGIGTTQTFFLIGTTDKTPQG